MRLSSRRSVAASAGADAVEPFAADLEERIRRTRSAIAALRHPAAADDRLEAAKTELALAVEATETASHTIFGEVERIEEIAAGLLAAAAPRQRAGLREIVDTVTRIYETLDFQDLAGRRLGAVRLTIERVERHVAALTATWDRGEIARLPLPAAAAEGEPAGPSDGAAAFGGLGRSEVDVLFD